MVNISDGRWLWDGVFDVQCGLKSVSGFWE